MEDLSTTEGVLEWVILCQISGDDLKTAAYLSECVRLRQAFDAPELAEYGTLDLIAVLRDAMEGV